MAGGKVFFICSCGMSILVPADAKFFYCWKCNKQWPRNPRAGRPVQYGKGWPEIGNRAWLERNRRLPRRRQPRYPNPKQPRYGPRTPPTRIQPANFRMNEPPVGPILGDPSAVAAPAVTAPAAAASAGMGFGSVLTIIFSIVILVVAVAFLANPSAFVDKVESILTSASSPSSSSSSSDSCAAIRQGFTSITNCTSSGYGCNKPGYSSCEAKLRNPQCTTMNGVRLCDADWQQICIPNKCIP